MLRKAVGVVVPRYREEYFETDVPQYLLHYPVDSANTGSVGSFTDSFTNAPVDSPSDSPVLLFVHGGPGFSQSFMGYQMKQWWGDLFSLVFWDQRGCGKSLAAAGGVAGAGAYPITTDAILRDMKAVVEHLKTTYAVEKVVVMGHSWGSIIGSLYARAHPDDLALYLGVGQVVEMRENERRAWEELRGRIVAGSNAKDLAALPTFEDIELCALPGEPSAHMDAFFKLKKKYGMTMRLGLRDLVTFLRNPVFSFADFSFMRKDVDRLRNDLVVYLRDFNLREHGTVYQMPVAYLLGSDDFSASTALAAAYFEEIQAPSKLLRVINGAGHNAISDTPQSFVEALRDARRLISKG
jgi:pimeloyl-ACP methyl ester carboxylesterase